MLHDLFNATKKPFILFAPAYAVAVYAYPDTVLLTWLTFAGLFGVYACLLAVWVSIMALDEIQIHWTLLRAKKIQKPDSCSGTKCNLNP